MYPSVFFTACYIKTNSLLALSFDIHGDHLNSSRSQYLGCMVVLALIVGVTMYFVSTNLSILCEISLCPYVLGITLISIGLRSGGTCGGGSHQ